LTFPAPKSVALPVTKNIAVDYRKDIQGLRALAVIFVLVFHINPLWLPGGFIGVDVFFVISGFLVSSIILKKLDNNTFSFAGFYTGRVKRIVPAYYFLLLCTGITGAAILIGSDVGKLRREFAHALLFNTDWLYPNISSYFGMSLQQDPLVHTWTIAVEMKFYLLLPVLLVWVRRRLLPYVIAGLLLVLLLYATYQIEVAHNTSEAYYSLFTRMPEFLAGILLALAPKNAVNTVVQKVAGFIGIALIVVCAFRFNHQTHFPGFAAMLPCLGAVLIIWGVNSPVSSLLATKPFEIIGALSYSLYLWHWPIITLMRYYNADNQFTFFQVFIIVALTFICSWLSYTFIENVFRKSSFRFFAGVTLPAGAVLIFLYLGMFSINHKALQIPEEYSGPSFGLKSHNVPYVETFGDTLMRPEILLIGNSHALCMKPYLDYLGRKNHFSFRAITCDSYPAIEGIEEKDALEMGRMFDYKQSRKLVGLTKKEIENARVIVLVINGWKTIPSLISAVGNMAADLKKGQKLVLLSPFPGLDKNPVQVNRDFLKDKANQSEYSIIRDKHFLDVEYLAGKYPYVYILNLEDSEAFKTAPFYNDTIMYYDSNHLNRYGAEVLAKHTENRFMDLLNALPE
jgi:peptidoglycan/LPS O-acetylase OafA/YrhL